MTLSSAQKENDIKKKVIVKFSHMKEHPAELNKGIAIKRDSREKHIM